MRVNVRFDADYAEDYVGNLISGTLERVPQLGELAYSGQRYSAVDVPYGADYAGTITGTWCDLTEEERGKHKLEVYCVTDNYYLVDSVTLSAGGFWQATVEQGSREIWLVDENGTVVDYAYKYLTDYVVDLYVVTDAEYLQDTCKIWCIGGQYRFHSYKARNGRKLAKVRRVSDGTIVGISGVEAQEKTSVWDYDANLAAEDALAFLKRQMNVSRFTHTLSFGEKYDSDYAGRFMWCEVSGFGDGDKQIAPKHISVDDFIAPDYSGVLSGTWHGLDDYTQYAVDIYEVTDQPYLVCSCALHPDGTWKTEKVTKVVETYDTEIVTYYRVDPVSVNSNSFKDIRLVKRNWDGIPIFDIPADETVPNTDGATAGVVETVLTPILISDEILDRPYARYADYKGRFYVYTDTEYLTAECEVYTVNDLAFFFTNSAEEGRKIAKLTHTTDTGYTVVGLCGGTSNITAGRFPASYLIPNDDPQYDKDGSTAMNLYGYVLNSRCFLYDVGLALLAFTISEDYDLCVEMMNRLRMEQNEDGSFNFSYDNYIGQLFEGYVRTGAIGWLVHGMCYYTLQTGDTSCLDIIRRAGDWLVSRQITDVNDPRYGLLTGGYGSYDKDYTYIEQEIAWCSTEHNCSSLQALTELALVLGDEKYKKTAALVKQALVTTLYDAEHARFYQGVGVDGVDGAWAVDCCTWAGKTLLSILGIPYSREIANTVETVYVTQDKGIVVSQEEEHYNTRYSGATVDGVKPYAVGYTNPPDIVWSEGTLGYIALLLAIGAREQADYYLNEMLKLQYCKNSTGGVLYVTETWASLPWEFHAWESLVSSAWLYILIKNPHALFPITARTLEPLVMCGNHGQRGYATIEPLR